MTWEQVEPGWYVCRDEDGRSLGAVYREAPSQWCVYVFTDKFPGDSQHLTLRVAKAAAEKNIRAFTYQMTIRLNGTVITECLGSIARPRRAGDP